MYGAVVRAHTKELEAYDTSNKVVRFDPTQPIPVALVTELVRARAAEIDGSGESSRPAVPFGAAVLERLAGHE